MTAVEWFFYEIKRMQHFIGNDLFEAFEQAKQIEKEQIEDAHIEGQRVFDKHPHTQWTNDQAEHYYAETYGSKGSDEIKPYWIGVVKWNDGTILITEPFYQYQDIKVWSSKFSYENTGKFESIDYKRIDGSKDFTYTEAQKNEERVNNAKIVKDATSSQTEISDEEIEEEAEKYPYGGREGSKRMTFMAACKWYREQLKKKI